MRRRWIGTGVGLLSLAGLGGVVAAHSSISGPIVRTIDAGAFPWAVAVDSVAGRAVVVDRTTDRTGMSPGSGSLRVIDLRDGALVHSFPVGTDPRAVALDERSGRIYVANDDDASVSVLDGRTGARLRTVTVGAQPRAVAVDATTGRAYVVNSGDGTVSVVDGGHGAALRTIHVGRMSPFGSVAAAVDGDRVMVGGGSTLAVLDARSGRLVRTITLNDDARRLAVDPRSGRIFVSGESALNVVDPRHGWAVRTLATGGQPSAVAIDAARRRVFVANWGASGSDGALTGAGTVSVVDADSGAVLRTITVGVAPSAVAVDGRSGDAVVVNAGGPVHVAGPWNWIPRGLSRLLPFLPADDQNTRSVPGSITVLDPSR